jgi:cold shock protein
LTGGFRGAGLVRRVMAGSQDNDHNGPGRTSAPTLARGGISEQPSVIELTGQIKWFDVAKGYGFIVPDNGLADILLHITCLHRDGYRVALEDARVVVAVVQSERGLQALRILSMDTSTAKHAAEMPPARTHVVVNATGPFERAQVRWFNPGAASDFSLAEKEPRTFLYTWKPFADLASPSCIRANGCGCGSDTAQRD